jgi:hypothetical protein
MQECRWDLWGDVLSDIGCLRDRSGKGWKLFVQLAALPPGVPAPLRGAVWQELCAATGADEQVQAAAWPALGQYSYAQLIAQRSAAEEQILKDVPRTLPQHELFKDRGGQGQTALFNVVKAFSLHDEEVGYCQGIANLTATLLLANYMHEEAAFSTLCELMSAQRYGPLRRQYVPGMPMLRLRMWQLERLLSVHLPRFSSHLTTLGILPTTFASEWFLTLFAQGDWPTAWVARVWDEFLLHGIVAIFATALAVCSLAESQCCVTATDIATTDISVRAQSSQPPHPSGLANCWDFERTVALLRRGIASQCCSDGTAVEGEHTEQKRRRDQLIDGSGGDAALTYISDGSGSCGSASTATTGSEPCITMTAVASHLLSSSTAMMARIGGQKALAKLEK